MTNHDPATSAQANTLTLDLDLAHAPEKVWRALTDPELLSQWLLPVAGFQSKPGTRFTFSSQPQPGWDGIVHCQIVECQPLEKLSYKWVVGDLDTVVTFTLARTATGTRLTLVHAGFKPEQKQNFAGARYGWKMMSDRLVELLPRVS